MSHDFFTPSGRLPRGSIIKPIEKDCSTQRILSLKWTRSPSPAEVEYLQHEDVPIGPGACLQRTAPRPRFAGTPQAWRQARQLEGVEVIVVEDWSKDDTPHVLDRFRGRVDGQAGETARPPV